LVVHVVDECLVERLRFPASRVRAAIDRARPVEGPAVGGTGRASRAFGGVRVPPLWHDRPAWDGRGAETSMFIGAETTHAGVYAPALASGASPACHGDRHDRQLGHRSCSKSCAPTLIEGAYAARGDYQDLRSSRRALGRQTVRAAGRLMRKLKRD
jgi:hypothetical protein